MKYLLIVLFTVLFFGYSEGRCKCEFMLKHYEELGCKAIYATEDDCCPAYYNCDDLIKDSVASEGTTPPTACYFRGRYYQEGQPIDTNVTMAFCRTGCHCQSGNIICAIVDCAEFFGDKLQPNCYRQYKHYQCCATGKQCSHENVWICTVGNKIYYEGQKFYPEDEPCLSCICQKGFNEKYEQPYCVPVNCNFEQKIKELREFCTPIYHGTKRCCATHWSCPNEKENMEKKIGQPRDENSDKTKVCFYGKRMLNVGEKFKLNKDTDCECNVPPLVTCIKTPQQQNKQD